MPAIILMIGALLWVVSEVLELVSGGFNDVNSSVSVAAFAAIGIGMSALWRAEGQDNTGRTGLALVALGMGLFALVAYQTIGSGIVSDVEQSDSVLFLGAGSAVSIGALALSYWLIMTSSYPKPVGVILLIATAFTLSVAFIPMLVGLQPLSNLVLAGTLFWLGWLSRRT